MENSSGGVFMAESSGRSASSRTAVTPTENAPASASDTEISPPASLFAPAVWAIRMAAPLLEPIAMAERMRTTEVELVSAA